MNCQERKRDTCCGDKTGGQRETQVLHVVPNNGWRVWEWAKVVPEAEEEHVWMGAKTKR